MSLWLAAGLLNARAERAIEFPAEQEIGELRLNFIRVSPQSGAIRYSLAKLTPILAGLVCLWWMAARIFSWQDAAAIAASGSIDDLARALTRVTGTADFWLWFYLAFTVANTMFPALRWKLSAAHKTAAAAAAGALMTVAWWIGRATEAFFAAGIESLAGSLALVMIQMILINGAAVLVLGALETLIELVTGKSAAFAGGKMIALSRREAQERKAMLKRELLASRQEQKGKAPVAAMDSVYALKLPIPGPPGREPLSRSAVTVLDPSDAQADRAPRNEPRSKPSSLPSLASARHERPSAAARVSDAIDSASPAAAERSPPPKQALEQAKAEAEKLEAIDGENAPFARPFVSASANEILDEANSNDAKDHTGNKYFPRPFAMKSRAEDEFEIKNAPKTLPASKRLNQVEAKDSAAQPRRFVKRTKPAPKPSRRNPKADRKPQQRSDKGLAYEPLEDEDVYIVEEDDCDAAPLSS